MFGFGGLAIFVMLVVTATPETADTADEKLQCLAELEDLEAKDTTRISIGCDTLVTESIGRIEFPVVRTNSRGLVRIKYAIKRVGSPGSGRRQKQHYSISERQGVLFFRPGENVISLLTFVSSDRVREADEEYLFQITETTRGTIARPNATVTVLDDDS